MVVARVGQGVRICAALWVGGAGEGQRMQRQRVGGQAVEADAADAAGRAGEAGVHHVMPQAQGLKDLGALVGGNGGDAHLGHHLQHPRIDRLHNTTPVRDSAESITRPGLH